MPWHKLFCIGASLCFYLNGKAQVFISEDPKYLKVKTETENLNSAYQNTYPDTSVTNLNNFFPRNFMGNTGLPAPSYFFNYGSDDAGFRFFAPPVTNDRISDKQIEYFRTKGPYAQITGIAGSKLLQAFKMLFTHTYKGKVNITMRFNRYSSQGFYLKQQTYANNFFLSSNYATKNSRFGYFAYILTNGNKNQENGGIKATVLNDSTVNLNKNLFPVRISAANRDNRETKAMINPWLQLNKIHDSLNGINHYLQLKTKGSLSAYKYKDTRIREDQFYNLIYYDTITLDSSHVKQLSNELAYTMQTADSKFVFTLGYKHEIVEVWQIKNVLFQNQFLVTDLVYRGSSAGHDSLSSRPVFFQSHFNAQYVLSGFNSGNYKIEGNASYGFRDIKKGNVFLNLLYEKRNPDRIYNDWYSNHFIWSDNGYKPQEQLQAKAGLSFAKFFGASVFYQNIFNYVYFDEIAYPRQYNKIIQNTAITLTYTDVFFKHLGLGFDYTFQSTSNTALIRIPQNTVTAKLFYTGNLFKNALQLQIGSQLQVYQEFYTYSYMPSTQAFYIQNSFKTAPYPFVDVYLNARIRPVSFFSKDGKRI